MRKNLEELLKDPKYVRKLIRKQNGFNFKVKILAVAAIVYVVKAEERAIRQELKIDRLSAELEAVKRGKEG